MSYIELSNESLSSLGGAANEDEREPEPEPYNDNSIEVTNDGLIIHRYYFPSFKSKQLRWEDIEWVKVGDETNMHWFHVRASGLSYYRNGLWIWWNAKTRLVNKERGTWGLRKMDDIRSTSMLVKLRGSRLVAGAYVKYPTVAAPIISEALDRNHLHNE
ncbi:hypothetical protein IW140_003104 [Coemansia sp. RSA 1813]|nr:hypothetical protein IW140_003104 [Coemansia sp. RSA 1813]